MPKDFNLDDILKNSEELRRIKEEIRRLDEIELNNIGRIFDRKQKISLLEKKLSDEIDIRNKMYNDYQKKLEDAEKMGKRVHANTMRAFRRKYEQQQRIITQNEKELRQLENKDKRIRLTMNFIKSVFKTDLMSLPLMNSLMEFDKSVKETALNLGLSTQQADLLRTNFEGAYKISSRLGASAKEMSEAQQAFSFETGRSSILTSQMLEDIMKMSKGLGIGAGEAGNLAGQFELIGYNATATMNYIQNVVDMSERVGVNTNKIIKSLNTNFKKLQTYNFKHGIDGMSRLAILGEKYKIDIGSAMTSMDKARNLEEVIDMAANLQVLGGQFAAMADPMAMLFESRNDPEAYAKRLSNMTKGMIALRKTSEGYSFELASPMARDMLDKAAHALGMSTEELTQQALRQRELTEMRKQMLGLNLNNSQKELIESLAKFDTKTGKFTIQVGSDIISLNKLSNNHLIALKKQQESLENRAKAAQTFDDVYKATIQEFKTVLLPLLRGINNTMGWIRKNVVEPISNILGSGVDNPLVKSITGFVGSVMVFSVLTAKITKSIFSFGKYISSLNKNIGGTSTNPIRNRTRGRGITNTSKTMSIKGGLGAGAGVGLAGIGVGAGVGIAAMGIGSIADSLDKLDPEKVKALESITWALTTLSGIATIAAAGIMIFGKASLSAAPGLLALGGGIALIGAGIGLATAGIGVMTMGLAQLIEKGAASKDSLLNVAGGIFAIQSALSAGIFGMAGLPAFAGALGAIALSANKIEKVGDAFGKITTVLNGSSSDFDKINNLLKSIKEFDTKKITSLTGLGEMFNKPIQVEFSNKEINLVSNITLEIDGKKFIEELNLVKRLKINSKDISDGKSSN